ncbi:MAG: hypothetical protein ACLSG4_17370, partial [Anaerobutyricum sp.]
KYWYQEEADGNIAISCAVHCIFIAFLKFRLCGYFVSYCLKSLENRLYSLILRTVNLEFE